MTLTNILFSLLMIAGISSCTSDQKLLRTYHKSSVYNGFAPTLSVAGIYQNKDTSLEGRWNLVNDLFPCHSYKRHCIKSNLVKQVALKYDGARHLQVDLHYSDGHDEQRMILVKNKGSYLSLKRSFFIIPIPILFFVEEEHKTLLLSDASGRLIAVTRAQDWGMAFLIGGSHDDRTATRLIRAEKPD